MKSFTLSPDEIILATEDEQIGEDKLILIALG
jgi:hypothetical protein